MLRSVYLIDYTLNPNLMIKMLHHIIVQILTRFVHKPALLTSINQIVT